MPDATFSRRMLSRPRLSVASRNGCGYWICRARSFPVFYVCCAIYSFLSGTSAAAGSPIPVPSPAPQVTAVPATEPAATIRLSPEALASFESALEEISRSARVTIVVEGIPFHQTLNEEQRKKLASALRPGTDIPVAYSVTAVAAAYDYDSERTGHGIFALRKRYSDPNELPLVTYEEVAQSLRSILKFLAPFNSTIRPFSLSLAWQLYDALTPEQKKKSVNAGITMADLSPDQQALAQSAAGEIVFRNQVPTLQQALDSVTLLLDPKTKFQWFQPGLSDKLSFGIKGNKQWMHIAMSYPLTNWYESNSEGYGRTAKFKRGLHLPESRRNGPYIDADFDLSAPDRALPTDEDRSLAAGMMVGRNASTLTLRQAAQRAYPPDADAAAVAVDDAVADKPVCVFGESFSAAPDSLKALCDVYGLELQRSEKGAFTISLPPVRRLRYNQDPHAELIKLIPPSIMRSFLAQTQNVFARMVPRPSPIDTSGMSAVAKAGLEEGLAQSRMIDARLKAEHSCYFLAVRRLLVLAMPLAPAPESAPVSVADAGPEALRLLAIMMLSDNPMHEINDLVTKPFPNCLLRPETMQFKMFVHFDGERYFVLADLNAQDATGTYQRVSNGGGMYTQAQLDAFGVTAPQ